MKRVKLVKLIDNVFKGEHPGGFSVGDEFTGQELRPLTVGKGYVVITGVGISRGFTTSTVQSILDDGIFTTLNSTYKLIDLDEKAKDKKEFSEKHEYLEEKNYYENRPVAKGRVDKTCDHCGEYIPKGTAHDVHSFYPEFSAYPTHKECTEKFLKSLN